MRIMMAHQEQHMYSDASELEEAHVNGSATEQ